MGLLSISFNSFILGTHVWLIGYLCNVNFGGKKNQVYYSGVLYTSNRLRDSFEVNNPNDFTIKSHYLKSISPNCRQNSTYFRQFNNCTIVCAPKLVE